MPLTLEELQEIQADAMADDLEIDFDKMSLWSKDEATEYFESGGDVVPGEGPPPPPPAAKLKRDDDAIKKWFPKWKPVDKPKFRMVCFHNAGSSESVYTGKGMRAKEDNPFVMHCATNGGELMACELPGREGRRNEPRSRTLKPYCEALLPILGPLLQEDVPYVVVGHSMGTWMSYEFCRLVCEKGFPLPKMLCISGFPSPSWPEAKRPWSKNAPMADPAFQDEARGWNVNEIVFQPANWKTFAPMMRDDFACFDEYVYTPPPAHLKKGEFPFPITARYFKDDKRCKKEHLSSWIDLTSEKASFSCTEFEGNHLFFYQVPERAKYMEDVVAKLPAEFKAVEIS